MELVLIVLGFLSFIAWRERQHASEIRAVAPRRGGEPEAAFRAPTLRSPGKVLRPRREKARVISADDDAAFLEARGVASAAEEGDES